MFVDEIVHVQICLYYFSVLVWVADLFVSRPRVVTEGIPGMAGKYFSVFKSAKWRASATHSTHDNRLGAPELPDRVSEISRGELPNANHYAAVQCSGVNSGVGKVSTLLLVVPARIL